MFPDAELVSVETRHTLSESMMENTCGEGYRHSEYAKQLISAALRLRVVSKETCQKLSEALLGNKARTGLANSAYMNRRISESQSGREKSEETRRRLSVSHKGNWKDPEYARRMGLSFGRKPNELELLLQLTLDKHFPSEWKYVGDGQLWIEGRNPDFVNINSRKQVIEVFGSFWHDPDYFPNRPSEEELIEHYRQCGFVCVILWDYEVWDGSEVVSKILQLEG